MPHENANTSNSLVTRAHCGDIGWHLTALVCLGAPMYPARRFTLRSPASGIVPMRAVRTRVILPAARHGGQG